MQAAILLERHGLQLGDPRLPVQPEQPHLPQRDGRARERCGAGALEGAFAVFGVQQGEYRPPDQGIRRGGAEQPGGGRIGEQDRAADVNPDALLHQIHDAREALLGRLPLRLALREGELGALLLGDVEVEAADADDAAVLVADRELDDEGPLELRGGGHAHLRHHGLAGLDDLAVEIVDERGIGGLGIDVADGLADELRAGDVEDALGLAVVEQVAALGVLDIGDERRVLHDRLEARFGGAQGGLGPHLLRDVVGGDEDGTAAAELHGGRADIDVDDRSRLQAMAPGADIAQAGRAVGDQVHQPRHVLRRADVGDAHGQELVAAVAVVLQRGLVDLEEGERAEVVEPHGRRVLVEQEAEARLFLDAGGRTFVRRRAAAGPAQAEVADDEAGEVGNLRQNMGVLGGEVAFRLVGQVDQAGGLAAGVSKRCGEAAAKGRTFSLHATGVRPTRMPFELRLRQPQRAVVAVQDETTEAGVAGGGGATPPARILVGERDMMDRLAEQPVSRQVDGGLMGTDDDAGFFGGDPNRFLQCGRGREARGGSRQGGKPAVCHAGSSASVEWI